MEVVRHANVGEATLRRLLEFPKRGVVHHAARARLEERGIAFGADGMPLEMSGSWSDYRCWLG
jgi:hypothetical protein